jgi:hypothetical protein
MTAPALEVADVIRQLADSSGNVPGLQLTYAQKRVLQDLLACRTPELGLHRVEQCDHCAHTKKTYNSCRNRCCPKCGGEQRAKWLDERSKDLLPVPYFHGVFTLPAETAQVALQNQKVVYNILFRASSETLKEVAADPRYLGAEIGFVAVLHTWGQTLTHHPHVHCLIPGGGIALDSLKWVACQETFFLPVHVLSAVYRDKFLTYLKAAFRAGELHFSGRLTHLADEQSFDALCEKWSDKGWVVHAKPPFAGPEVVLKYLARYTNRVAIGNGRLVSFEDAHVTFRYKDYARGGEQRIMRLDGVEFLRRFLMHVPPSGFMSIRHYGLLANCHRRKKLAVSRELLAQAGVELQPDYETSAPQIGDSDDNHHRCPACGLGTMQVVHVFPRPPRSRRAPRTSPRMDSS